MWRRTAVLVVLAGLAGLAGCAAKGDPVAADLKRYLGGDMFNVVEIIKQANAGAEDVVSRRMASDPEPKDYLTVTLRDVARQYQQASDRLAALQPSTRDVQALNQRAIAAMRAYRGALEQMASAVDAQDQAGYQAGQRAAALAKHDADATAADLRTLEQAHGLGPSKN